MKNWRLLLGLLVSALFIWFSLRQVKDWNTFLNSFRQIKLWLFAPVFIGYSLVMVIRAWRWQYIMKSRVPVKYSSSFIGLIIGYMGNNILPFRAGELMRCLIVAKREKKDFSPIFASVVVERIFDSIAIVLFLPVILIFLKFPAEQEYLKSLLRKGGIAALVMALGLMVFLYLLYFYRERTLKLAGAVLKLAGKKLHDLAVCELDKFSRGLTILGSPFRMFAALLLSLAVWLVNLFPIWFTGIGFGAKLNFIAALFLLCLGAFAAAIPAAPGFWGTFHYINTVGLKFLGALGPEHALSFSIVLHSLYYFPTLILGLILLWREGLSIFELEGEAKKIEQKPASE